ncbi:transposable element Tcb1 transposase [Trichonephila clavipes]|nr:transposable element Tcb1 transposase [Trichonephila clavipes]
MEAEWSARRVTRSDLTMRCWEQWTEDASFTVTRLKTPPTDQSSRRQSHHWPLSRNRQNLQYWSLCSRTIDVTTLCLRHITNLLWPALYPDLSPIEHIWDYVGRQVEQPTSLVVLEARLQQLWNETSRDIIRNLRKNPSLKAAITVRTMDYEADSIGRKKQNIDLWVHMLGQSSRTPKISKINNVKLCQAMLLWNKDMVIIEEHL